MLEHVAGIDALLATISAEDRADLIAAVLGGAGDVAARYWEPTNRTGDREHPQQDGSKVIMPAGFRDAYRQYVDGGWGTIAGPAEFGGQGLPHVLALAAMESFGAANMGFGLCPILTLGAVEALRHHGDAELNSFYLPKLVTGEWTGTMNLTEPQAGSDVGAIRTTANRAEDGSWRIKGAKIFITFGEHDLSGNIVHLVLAKTSDAPPGTRGLSLFLVPKIRPDGTRNDVYCTAVERKLGIHSSPTCAMAFGDDDDCHGWLVGAERGGMRAMFTMMNSARLHIGAQGVQVAERSTQRALTYARERIQSALATGASKAPVAIVEHPDVRRMLVRMQAQTQAARALVYLAASEIDRAEAGDENAKCRLDLLTPLAKSHATDIGCEVSSLGIQVHGGVGYIEDTGAAQHFRDARIAPIYEGTNGIQAMDFVERKIIPDSGAALRELVCDIESTSRHVGLRRLTATISNLLEVVERFSVMERLAASTPFLTMSSIMVCGWLMERQQLIAAKLLEVSPSPFLRQKFAISSWYLDNIVPEAMGLSSSIENGERNLADALAN